MSYGTVVENYGVNYMLFGLIIGIIGGVFEILSIPTKAITTMNGAIVSTKTYSTSEAVESSFTTFMSSILYSVVFAILFSISITLIAFLFNLICKATGGIKIYIEE